MKLLTSLSILLWTHCVYAIWPAPHGVMSSGTTTLLLGSQFSITPPTGTIPQDLTDAIGRSKAFLGSDKLGRLIVGRGSSDASSLGSAKQLSSLGLKYTGSGNIASISSEAIAEIGTRDEQYDLVVPSDGTSATLSANSSLGFLRGLTTFEQLWYYFNGTTYATNAPLHITDSPSYVS